MSCKHKKTEEDFSPTKAFITCCDCGLAVSGETVEIAKKKWRTMTAPKVKEEYVNMIDAMAAVESFDHESVRAKNFYENGDSEPYVELIQKMKKNLLIEQVLYECEAFLDSMLKIKNAIRLSDAVKKDT